MKAAEFLDVARSLKGNSPHAAINRTIMGRAYYASFLSARDLLDDWGFSVGRRDNAHAVVQRYLINSGNAKLIMAGRLLSDLHRWRLSADYNLRDAASEHSLSVEDRLREAARVLELLDEAASDRSEICQGISAYLAKISPPGST